MKKKTFSACIMAALLTAGVANTQATAGVLSEGNISVYKGGHLASTITGQNPVDEEALMVCNEKCMIKSSGVSLVGATGTELAVKSDQEQFNLLLKKGKLDFLLNGAVKKMGFYTADKQYTHADAIFSASTDNAAVRGYMEVTPTGGTKIGVYEGRLVFDTVDGAKTVDSNNYILLAQADMGDANDIPMSEVGMDDGAGFWTTEVIIGGTVVAAAAAYGLYEYLDDDDDDDSASSSSTPSSSSSSSSGSNSSSSSSSSSGSSSSSSSSTNPSANN